MKKLLKALSTALSLILLYESAAVPLAQASALRPLSPAPVAAGNTPFSLPLSIGQMVNAPRLNGQTIYHIQDIHTDIAAQTNLYGIVTELYKHAASNGKKLLVFVEGSTGLLDSDLISSMPDKDAVRDVGAALLRKGILFGEEYAAITQAPGAIRLVGVETPELYRQNGLARDTTTKARAQVLADVRETNRQLSLLNKHNFNPILARLEQARKSVNSDGASFVDYVKILNEVAPSVVARHSSVSKLVELAKKEKALDFPRIEAAHQRLIADVAAARSDAAMKSLVERAVAVKEGRLSPLSYYSELLKMSNKPNAPIESYVAYLKAAHDVDTDSALDALGMVENDVAQSLLKHPVARQLYAHQRWMERQEKFFALEMVPQEWKQQEKTQLNDIISTLSDIRAFIAEQKTAMGYGFETPMTSLKELAQAFDGASAFYRAATLRDQAMSRNIQTYLRNNKDDNREIVFIAGGFHTPGIVKSLEKNGANVAVLRPQIETSIRLSDTVNFFRAPGALVNPPAIKTAIETRQVPPVSDDGFGHSGHHLRSILLIVGASLPFLMGAASPQGTISTNVGAILFLSGALLATIFMAVAGYYYGNQSYKEGYDDGVAAGKKQGLEEGADHEWRRLNKIHRFIPALLVVLTPMFMGASWPVGVNVPLNVVVIAAVLGVSAVSLLVGYAIGKDHVKTAIREEEAAQNPVEFEQLEAFLPEGFIAANFSPNKTFLVGVYPPEFYRGQNRAVIRLVNLKTQVVGTGTDLNLEAPAAVTINDDGSEIAVKDGGEVKLWTPKSRQLIRIAPRRIDMAVANLQFIPGTHSLVSSGETLWVHDTTAKDGLTSEIDSRIKQGLYTVSAFDIGKKRTVVAYTDGIIRVFTKERVVPFTATTDRARSVALSPDEALVLAVYPDEIRILNAETGLVRARFRSPKTDTEKVTFSADGRSILFLGRDGKVVSQRLRKVAPLLFENRVDQAHPILKLLRPSIVKKELGLLLVAALPFLMGAASPSQVNGQQSSVGSAVLFLVAIFVLIYATYHLGFRHGTSHGAALTQLRLGRVTLDERKDAVDDNRRDQETMVTTDLTEDHLQKLEQTAKAYGLTQQSDKFYLAVMWGQILRPVSKVLSLISNPDVHIPLPGDTQNFWLSSKFFGNKSVWDLLGVIDFRDGISAEQKEQDAAARRELAQHGDVIIDAMEAGLGENFTRVLYNNKKVRDAARFELNSALGAKGTDVQFKSIKVKAWDVSGRPSYATVNVSIAELKLRQIILQARRGDVKHLTFEVLVNKDSKPHYDKLLASLNLDERVDHRIASPRTYQQVFNDFGITVKFHFQDPIPGINAETNELPDEKGAPAQPGGHGQLGMWFFFEALQRGFERVKNGVAGTVQNRFRVFYNGDNLNSRANTDIIAHMKQNKHVIYMVAVAAQPIDKKGGKIGLRAEWVDGKLVWVPDMMELAQAKAADKTDAGQLNRFFDAGLENGDDLQLFNSNIIYINEDLLADILADLHRLIAARGGASASEERVLYEMAKAFAPTRIAKDAKSGFLPVDGAIGSVLLNFNQFFLTSTDPEITDILKKHGVDRILRFVNVPRIEHFTAEKTPVDHLVQTSDRFELDPESSVLVDKTPGAPLPEISIRGVANPGDETANWVNDSGAWADLATLENGFGKIGIRNLKSLEVFGAPFYLGDATFLGRVRIVNELPFSTEKAAFNLRAALVQEHKQHEQDLRLKDVVVTIQADGRVTIKPYVEYDYATRAEKAQLAQGVRGWTNTALLSINPFGLVLLPLVLPVLAAVFTWKGGTRLLVGRGKKEAAFSDEESFAARQAIAVASQAEANHRKMESGVDRVILQNTPDTKAVGVKYVAVNFADIFSNDPASSRVSKLQNAVTALQALAARFNEVSGASQQVRLLVYNADLTLIDREDDIKNLVAQMSDSASGVSATFMGAKDYWEKAGDGETMADIFKAAGITDDLSAQTIHVLTAQSAQTYAGKVNVVTINNNSLHLALALFSYTRFQNPSEALGQLIDLVQNVFKIKIGQIGRDVETQILVALQA